MFIKLMNVFSDNVKSVLVVSLQIYDKEGLFLKNVLPDKHFENDFYKFMRTSDGLSNPVNLSGVAFHPLIY
ncbi:MAG: hypothetical protein DWQ02_06170 [Bacteroidetes bacterium]|nr:MAG: hypothetical protein DWQ02_06170 [Bacteroidota bacterium]